MPRRPPAAIRLDRVVSAQRRTQHVDGLSAAARRVIDRLEAERRWPGATAAALSNYEDWVLDPAHRISAAEAGCGFPECCPEADDLRGWLETVMHHLPRRDRRVLGGRIAAVDDRW